MTNKIKVEYNTNNGSKNGIVVKRPGRCCICPSTWSLTKHHIFGKSENITIRICQNCHSALHREVESGGVGPFGRHVFAILAQCFPITSNIPDWNKDEYS